MPSLRTWEGCCTRLLSTNPRETKRSNSCIATRCLLERLHTSVKLYALDIDGQVLRTRDRRVRQDANLRAALFHCADEGGNQIGIELAAGAHF